MGGRSATSLNHSRRVTEKGRLFVPKDNSPLPPNPAYNFDDDDPIVITDPYILARLDEMKRIDDALKAQTPGQPEFDPLQWLKNLFFTKPTPFPVRPEDKMLLDNIEDIDSLWEKLIILDNSTTLDLTGIMDDDKSLFQKLIHVAGQLDKLVDRMDAINKDTLERIADWYHNQTSALPRVPADPAKWQEKKDALLNAMLEMDSLFTNNPALQQTIEIRDYIRDVYMRFAKSQNVFDAYIRDYQNRKTLLDDLNWAVIDAVALSTVLESVVWMLGSKMVPVLNRAAEMSPALNSVKQSVEKVVQKVDDLTDDVIQKILDDLYPPLKVTTAEKVKPELPVMPLPEADKLLMMTREELAQWMWDIHRTERFFPVPRTPIPPQFVDEFYGLARIKLNSPIKKPDMFYSPDYTPPPGVVHVRSQGYPVRSGWRYDEYLGWVAPPKVDTQFGRFEKMRLGSIDVLMNKATGDVLFPYKSGKTGETLVGVADTMRLPPRMPKFDFGDDNFHNPSLRPKIKLSEQESQRILSKQELGDILNQARTPTRQNPTGAYIYMKKPKHYRDK